MSDLTIEMPTSGATLAYLDAENGRVTYLDRVRPEHLAEHDRRSLRITEVLLEEALDNVRDALHRRGIDAHQPRPLGQDRT